MDDTQKYRELFFEETDEYLQTLNDCVLELEKNPEDSGLLDEIFQCSSYIKGYGCYYGVQNHDRTYP